MEQQPDPQWLDSMYNNRARVPDAAERMAGWGARSAPVRAQPGAVLDIAYGPGPRERLDVFPASHVGAPVLVFIHGGYWRAMDKSAHAFLAPVFNQAGACVVVPGYSLCPGTADTPVTIPHIVLQLVAALAWTWRHVAAYGGDPARITVVGHSAGGHLAAMMLGCRWQAHAPDLPARLVKNALSISGLHELETLRRTPYLQESLLLTPDDARRASPAWLPPPRGGVLHAVSGGDESEEYWRHTRLIRSAWGSDVVPVCDILPGLNHFTILEALAQPGSRVHALAMELLGLGPRPAT